MPVGDDRRIIAHICNDMGLWGRGFVKDVAQRWPSARSRYLAWHRLGGPTPFALGEVQLVGVEPSLWIANMIGQHGIRTVDGIPPIRYDAVRQALAMVALCAHGLDASIHMPRIGCGLANGTWEPILAIIEGELLTSGLSVTVYDLPT